MAMVEKLFSVMAMLWLSLQLVLTA
ncbi:hypothetical protein ZOSMA_18G01150 [Zostera marina]|uniref:Uncharacterized protein n=1 Tax=Zostera marina TaxID=29655 RepID=A0A0K9PS20_ZOSMR|nr:hypothetical protein ZOSMA_18G01150 [Zostera marina]